LQLTSVDEVSRLSISRPHEAARNQPASSGRKEKKMKQKVESRIYVACLASYNAGRLHGEWIDLDNKSEDDVHAEIQAMLKASKETDAEEYAIHDYELPFKISEYEGIDTILEQLEKIAEHGEAWQAYCEYFGKDYATESDFRDRYQGEWSSEQAFAENIADDTILCEVDNETVKRYFDYESFSRDLFLDGYTFVNGHVFTTY
jgi:antirestriction protein